MSTRLRDNITSAYIEAANRMTSKNSRRRIVAYVESYDDILFWRTILSQYEDSTRQFEVMLPAHKRLERGKRPALTSLMPNVGKDMIACVDADYDYLMQGLTDMSRHIINNPYILHTYAYAIENLQCYAPSLHNVCVMATLNDTPLFDFEDFLKQYSIAVFPLFVWSIWHYRRNIYDEFTIGEFNQTIFTGNFDLNNPQAVISRVRNKVWRKIKALQKRHPDAKESYLQLKAELISLGVTPESAYLYIQGHHLFDKIVLPVVNRVCGILTQIRESEIRRQSKHYTQMNNELSCYRNSTQDTVQMLKKNMGYITSEPFRRIQQDVEHFLSINNSDKASETGQ